MDQEYFLFQVLIIGVAVVLVFRTIVLFLRKGKSLREVLLSFLIWGTFALISVFPGLIEGVGRLLGFRVGSNAVFTISIILLFFISLRLYLRLDKLEASVTKLTRNIAIDKLRD